MLAECKPKSKSNIVIMVDNVMMIQPLMNTDRDSIYAKRSGCLKLNWLTVYFELAGKALDDFRIGSMIKNPGRNNDFP